MNKETREEYLESLYKLAQKEKGEKIKTGQISDFLDIAPSTVTEILPILDEKGYIEYIPYYGVKLTEKGLEEGKRLVRSHRILEVFLERYFSLEKDKLHDKACKMEHIFDTDMIDTICERMGAPTKCPHGNVIPKCKRSECPVKD